MTKYEKALLDMIAYAEGTLGVSKNGYDVTGGFYRIIGWTENTSIVHGQSAWYNKEINSTAAGRYQFLGSTWADLDKGEVNLPFTKDNQDKMALDKINKRLKSKYSDSRDVKTTQLENRTFFDIMLNKLAPEWASIPLTKDVTTTYDGKKTKHFKGSGFYSSDGINKTSKTADKLYSVFIAALEAYS